MIAKMMMNAIQINNKISGFVSSILYQVVLVIFFLNFAIINIKILYYVYLRYEN